MKKLAIEKINCQLEEYVEKAKNYAILVNEAESESIKNERYEKAYTRVRFLVGQYRGYCKAFYDMEIISKAKYLTLKSNSREIMNTYWSTLK